MFPLTRLSPTLEFRVLVRGEQGRAAESILSELCPGFMAAGPRTELKHIIKSRKRKQQQFP